MVFETARSLDIRDAALTLFAEQGYRATTMNDIAYILGIRAPSLYHHVPSKQLLLQAIMEDTMNELIKEQQLAMNNATDVADQFRRTVEGHVRYHVRHRREAFVGNRELGSLEDMARGLIQEKRDAYELTFRSIIERGLREQRFHETTARLASYAVIQMGIGAADWFRSDGPVSESAVVYEYGEFALRLVGATARPHHFTTG